MASKKRGSEDDDLLKEAKEAFGRAQDAENDNRKTSLDDVNFARKGDQWDEKVRKQRETDHRPCLTINKMPAFIRQVVNDARQNKPSIKVHPVDSGADPETADVLNGLIRNIEYTSNADVAYDTGAECAVTGGFGYWRVGLDYAFDDSFEMDIRIKRVANPLSVYGDPNSTEADSSDWDTAFVVENLSKSQYENQYKGKAKVDWDDAAWTSAGEPWKTEDKVLVAEWWKREEIEREVLLFLDIRDGTPVTLTKEQAETDPDVQALLAAQVLQFKQKRTAKSHKVCQYILSGAEVLERRDWPGRYIPIVPVYGDEFNIEGKRYFRSLIHNAKDAQRMVNYWRTTATELVALAPRVPYIGRKGAFDHDQDRWNTANTVSHPYLEYEGPDMPQRQPLDSGVAAGALQEALNASDDMKAIIGLHDASLGARSNETSGKAIMARQREGDVSTFHFQDNKARAIRHTGRILIDLIPKVYTSERIIRVIGEDGTQEAKQVNKEYQKVDPKTGQPMTEQQIDPATGQPMIDPMTGKPITKAVMAMHDLTSGKYDLTVTTGPSFTTRREEAAMQMTEMIRAFPQAATVVGPELAKNLDWPGADKIAEKLEAMTTGQIPPQVQKAIEDGKQQIAQLTEENQNLKLDQATDQQKLKNEMLIADAKIKSAETIKIMEIQSDERIAKRKAEMDANVKAYAAQLASQNAAEANRMKASRPDA